MLNQLPIFRKSVKKPIGSLINVDTIYTVLVLVLSRHIIITLIILIMIIIVSYCNTVMQMHFEKYLQSQNFKMLTFNSLKYTKPN